MKEVIMSNTILKISELKKHFKSGEDIVTAVDGVSFDAQKGEFITVVGRSGCGKTTLLNLLGGLDIPDSGSITVLDQAYDDFNEDQLTEFRRTNMGFIFQSYNLLSILNVKDNILLPLGLEKASVDTAFFDDVITTLRIEDKLNKPVTKLSGGEQQRVAIARALITEPAMILADEPTGNLDTNTGAEVLELLRATSRKWHQLIIMVTHDVEIAKMSDRTIHMSNGQITDITTN